MCMGFELWRIFIITYTHAPIGKLKYLNQRWEIPASSILIPIPLTAGLLVFQFWFQSQIGCALPLANFSQLPLHRQETPKLLLILFQQPRKPFDSDAWIQIIPSLLWTNSICLLSSIYKRLVMAIRLNNFRLTPFGGSSSSAFCLLVLTMQYMGDIKSLLLGVMLTCYQAYLPMYCVIKTRKSQRMTIYPRV